MNKLRTLLLASTIFTVFSCEKEYSQEEGNLDDPLIVGADCRISKIVSTDTSGTAIFGSGVGLGSIEGVINSQDVLTTITDFDSINGRINYVGMPVYTNDSIYISSEEYFIADANKRITKLHGLTDPTNTASPQFDVFYVYNAAGYLVTKNYNLTNPVIPYYQVNYTYNGGNLTHVERIDKFTNDFDMDADIEYYTTYYPRRFIYLFPDDDFYPAYNQFFDFGLKNLNAVKKMKIRHFDPGNVVRDSAVSYFNNYFFSKDKYILSVQLDSADVPSIPALAGKLTFSYHCK